MMKARKAPQRVVGVPLPDESFRRLRKQCVVEKRSLANLGRVLIEEGLDRRNDSVAAERG